MQSIGLRKTPCAAWLSKRSSDHMRCLRTPHSRGALLAHDPCRGRHLCAGWKPAKRQRQSRGMSVVVQAISIRRLPIFPLGMVAFPTAEVPLNIFEARYRVLFSTLLAGAEGIDEDLVQQNSEFLASRQFGMTYCNPEGGVADVGTILEIDAHSTLEDGRIIVNTRGKQRFRILKVLEQRPVLVAECEILDEVVDEEDNVEAQILMEEVSEKFRAVWQLNGKLRKRANNAVPGELTQLGPKAFSYWLAGMFHESQPAQQMLLQEGSVVIRLRYLSDIFDKQLGYLRAAVALESLGSVADEGSPAPSDQQDAQKDNPPPKDSGSPKDPA